MAGNEGKWGGGLLRSIGDCRRQCSVQVIALLSAASILEYQQFRSDKTPSLKMCLLQKFVHSTIACSVSRTVELCAMLCASRSLRSPTPPQTTAITCQYAFVCRLHTVCVRSIYRLYAVSMLMGHLLARCCSVCVGVQQGLRSSKAARLLPQAMQQGLRSKVQWGVACVLGCSLRSRCRRHGQAMPYCIALLHSTIAYALPYPIGYISYCIARLLHSKAIARRAFTHCYNLGLVLSTAYGHNASTGQATLLSLCQQQPIGYMLNIKPKQGIYYA